MKTLYLVRHAKSSWDDLDLDDFERPLNKRGKRDAPAMGARLKEQHILPELLLSSPAKRAGSTARAIAEIIRYDPARIKWVDALYLASAHQIAQVVQQTDEEASQLMLFGHNPGLTDFAHRVGAQPIDNIVTAGVYALQLEINRWKELKLDKSARLLFYDYPKKHL